MPTAARKPRTPATPKAQALREQEMRSSMAELIRNIHFARFIDQLREQRENAILDSINDATAGSERLSLLAKGEVRCYTDIIRLYDEWFAKLSEETGNVEPFGPQG